MNRRKTCRACGGTKKVMGIGYMSKICDKCWGVGYFEVDEVKDEIITHDLPAMSARIEDAETHGDIELHVEQPKKKRGRPPKKKEDE